MKTASPGTLPENYTISDSVELSKKVCVHFKYLNSMYYLTLSMHMLYWTSWPQNAVL